MKKSSPQQLTARSAGLLYTLMIPLGVFGIMYVPASMVVTGSIETTIQNVIAHTGIFRLSILTALTVQISHIFIVLLLYQLLKPVSHKAASLMVIFMLVSIPVTMANELNHLAVLFLVNHTQLPADQLNPLADLFFHLHDQGIFIAGIFWGLWLLPMGYLVYQSEFLPRFIGILLTIAGCGYVIDSALRIVIPAYGDTIAATIIGASLFGEIVFPLWLLIMGIKINKAGTKQ